MHNEGDETHINETEVTGGKKTGHVRWILGVGLFLAIGFLSIIWITGAFSQGDVESQATVTATNEARSDTGGTSTDSIVGEDADEIDTPIAE